MADIEEELQEEKVSTDEYYGIEQERPAKKIFPKEQEKTRSLRLKRYREHSLARFSNIYMLVGMLLGVAVFYFLVAPEIKAKYIEEIREQKTEYNKIVSTKNNEIENLKLERDSLSTKNSEYESKQTTMQTTIDNLTTEVETLKRTVENNGITTTEEDKGQGDEEDKEDKEDVGSAEAEDTEKVEDNSNAAAERNNANVIGISGDSVEGVISEE